MDHYKVPYLSIDYFSETDLDRLNSESRNPLDICCMRDPNDPANGFFLWIDEEGDSPQGYSETFAKLWYWAQTQGYTWIRVADWGDAITELETDG
ncbi:MAG: hypothetical protein WCD18_06855 [Thermosynechococcaceae cyanobacterium]